MGGNNSSQNNSAQEDREYEDEARRENQRPHNNNQEKSDEEQRRQRANKLGNSSNYRYLPKEKMTYNTLNKNITHNHGKTNIPTMPRGANGIVQEKMSAEEIRELRLSSKIGNKKASNPRAAKLSITPITYKSKSSSEPKMERAVNKEKEMEEYKILNISRAEYKILNISRAEEIEYLELTERTVKEDKNSLEYLNSRLSNHHINFISLIREGEQKREDPKFYDREFPPVGSSIIPMGEGISNNQRNIEKLRKMKIEWGRPSEIWDSPLFYVSREISALNIIQGDIGDCYFLSGIASIAETDPVIISNAFITQHPNPFGIYALKLYINGNSQVVIIDDLFPYTKNLNNTKCLAFGRTKQPRELWVSILEKAWGKICGSYSGIVSGSYEALSFLTGAPVLLYNNLSAMNYEELWKNIVDYINAG